MIHLEELKKLVIIALASDDFLLEKLVLKGGNAIDLLNPPNTGKLSRASYDLDFSIEDDFDEDIEDIIVRITNTLETTFAGNGLHMFDFKFANKPKGELPEEFKDFWGGYNVSFKLITAAEFERLKGNLNDIRKLAIKVRPNQSTRIEIEISKYEYIADKMELEVDGHLIFIYTPQMIAFEKLRAICQQLPAYGEIIPSHSPRPRARDFYDMHLIMDQHRFDVDTDVAKELIRTIFSVKRVPLTFIQQIPQYADIHRQDWQNVLDTLPNTERDSTQPFEFYLDFVYKTFGGLTFP